MDVLKFLILSLVQQQQKLTRSSRIMLGIGYPSYKGMRLFHSVVSPEAIMSRINYEKFREDLQIPLLLKNYAYL
jgi:hypothetical protein